MNALLIITVTISYPPSATASHHLHSSRTRTFYGPRISETLTATYWQELFDRVAVYSSP